MDQLLSSIIKTNRVGDSFNWWVGQVEETTAESSDNKGGYRLRVRIVGDHPQSKEILNTKDLPWAQVMMPVNVPFMPGISGVGGVSQIVCGPTEKVLNNGDILFIDTGSTYDGYFCDFNRNYAFGEISSEVERVHETLWLATEAGIKAAVPGATTDEVWLTMNTIIQDAGAIGNNVGRLGHGLGLQLTEPPSHRPGDNTRIVENMVLTIEPVMEYAPGKMIVHEENIAITKDGSRLLTKRAPRQMPIIK